MNNQHIYVARLFYINNTKIEYLFTKNISAHKIIHNIMQFLNLKSIKLKLYIMIYLTSIISYI